MTYERKSMGTAAFAGFNGPLLISSNYLLIGIGQKWPYSTEDAESWQGKCGR